MKQIETKIRIDAPAGIVWEILTDLDRYPEWNPFIRQARGDVFEGAKLEVSIFPPGGKAMLFKPTLLTVETDCELRWLGHFLFPGIFDGEHAFMINENENGCEFVQKETFSGLLVPLVWKSMAAKTREGFERMNEALKKRGEQLYKGNNDR